MPEWLKGDVLDVRKVITYCLSLQEGEKPGAWSQKPTFPKVSDSFYCSVFMVFGDICFLTFVPVSNFLLILSLFTNVAFHFSQPGMPFPRRRTLNIPQQLRALSLPAFVGRQHSGIDVGIFFYPRGCPPSFPSLSVLVDSIAVAIGHSKHSTYSNWASKSGYPPRTEHHDLSRPPLAVDGQTRASPGRILLHLRSWIPSTHPLQPNALSPSLTLRDASPLPFCMTSESFSPS